MERLYRVGEFAALTKVSVRTLHHYDRIGLLRPSKHTDGRQRLYSEQDLLCLHQILTLRFLGFPLAQIRELLRQPDFDLVRSLIVQRRVVRQRIAHLEKIGSVLNGLIESRLATGDWDWDAVARAATAVQDGHAVREDLMTEYYTPEQQRQFEELAREMPPGEREAIERQWTELLAEVRANRHLDPTSAEARRLAKRWNALAEQTRQAYESKPGLWQAIGNAHQQNAFADRPEVPQAEDFAFITRVNEAHSGER